MKNYKLEKIKEELTISLARDQEILRLWEAVEYKTKKDGQPFKLVSKSFENTTYRKASYGNYYILEVSSLSSDLGYINDWVRLEEYRTKEKITDVEKIKEMIEKKKRYFRNEIMKEKSRLNKLDSAFVEFETAYTKALGQLAYDLGCTKKFDSLFYRITKIVTDN